jgi:OmpA-OmpF porin, OOP family
MNWKTGCLAGAMAALLPAAAMAQSPGAVDRGFYVSLGAGVNWVQGDIDTDRAGSIGSDDPGWAGSAALGYDFGQFRVELEGYYRNNNPDVGSYFDAVGGIVNVLYDFDFGFPLKPHIGVGIGYGQSHVKQVDSDWDFIIQGIAGVEYAITPNIAAFVDYRYLNNDWLASGNVQWDSHAVLGGVRFTFGSPRPAPMPVTAPPPPLARPLPPPPPPAPAPVVRSYLVFFDFNRSNLTPEATRIVQTAAQNARSGGVTRIAVTGHADRSGTPAYNMALSRRRAETVRAELVRNGVSPSDISVSARGESDPLVPTPDGVREPQNRRVEIVFQ